MKTFILFIILTFPFCSVRCNTCFSHRTIVCDVHQDTDSHITTFLDWTISETVPLYNSPGGSILTNLLCKNENTDDITMMDILEVNDSMYQVSVFSGESDSVIGKGWIYKDIPIRVVDRLYNSGDELIIFDKPNGMNVIISLTATELPDTGLLNVINVCIDNGWIKIRIWKDNQTVEGWIPPGSYCSNPYTTCG